MKRFFSLIVVFVLVFTLCACKSEQKEVDLWENAMYTTDTVLGEGEKTVTVSVTADSTTVSFTIHSDEKYLGKALLFHELITGEEGEYGLFIKSVNGIVADYDVDKYYWGFYKDGEYMLNGIDTTEFKDGEHYELVRTK